MPINSPQEVRHYILRMLDHAQPIGASTQLLSTSLLGIGLSLSGTQLLVQLNYLAGKGYITTEEVEDRFTKISRTISKLTPKGLDLMEGNIAPDPGIGLSQE